MRKLVSVVVVTYDSETDIADCLDSIGRQSYTPLETLVIDNDSSDGTKDVVRSSSTPFRFIENDSNRGFAAAHNQGIRLTRGELYLAVNPDVAMTERFIEELVNDMEAAPTVGAVTGKLLRPAGEPGPRLIDTTGIYMTPSLRHLDRGSGEPDLGQYERAQFVFGASGAAALYRRRMLEDVAVDGEYFDEDFFAYREDADLAWRAQLFGWRTLYVPRALATHKRRVLPERRRNLPAVINMHSVKNRFLLRLKNQTLLELVVLFLPALVRDAQVIVYVVLFERSSVPGLLFVARNIRRVWSKRRQIMKRRRTPARTMLRWFSYKPISFDLGDI
ncbi:MAG: glycosyltransferase family 2 protein [Acidobacteriota bacterium]|nr:MAG: glycosyltransferase family 2 protein [Acidobacteriota bacterium]